VSKPDRGGRPSWLNLLGRLGSFSFAFVVAPLTFAIAAQSEPASDDHSHHDMQHSGKSVDAGEFLPTKPLQDQGDMGAPAAKPGAVWNTLDEGLREKFDEDFGKTANRRALYDEYLDAMSGEALLDYLELRDSRCHGDAHELGNAIYERSQNITEALRICGHRCTNACMHGVVKQALGGRSPAEVRAQMGSFCEQGEMSALHKPGNCAHGLGHAAMLSTGHDIEASLSACEGFDDLGMEYYCATGVFMEYRDAVWIAEQRGQPVKRASLHYPCDTYTKFPPACYRYVLSMISDEQEATFDDLVQLCLTLPEQRKRGCFHGVGAFFSRTVSDQPQIFPELCQHGSGEDQILCVDGVIEKLADFDAEHAKTVCATLDGERRVVCDAGVEGKMYRLPKSRMELYGQ